MASHGGWLGVDSPDRGEVYFTNNTDDLDRSIREYRLPKIRPDKDYITV